MSFRTSRTHRKTVRRDPRRPPRWLRSIGGASLSERAPLVAKGTGARRYHRRLRRSRDSSYEHRALCIRDYHSFFSTSCLHSAAIQTFGGGYGFVLASNEIDFDAAVTETIVERASALTGELSALTPRAFPGCFAVPRYLADTLERPAPPPNAALADQFNWLYSK